VASIMRERQIETSLGGSPNYNCLHVFCCCVLRVNAQRTKLIGDSHSLLGMRFVQFYSFSCAARKCKPSKRKEETATRAPSQSWAQRWGCGTFSWGPAGASATLRWCGGCGVPRQKRRTIYAENPRPWTDFLRICGEASKNKSRFYKSFLFHRPETISV